MDTPYFIPFPGDRIVRIYHRTRGCGRDEYAVAECRDSDTAQRIVDLLNADEAAKEARQWRVKHFGSEIADAIITMEKLTS